MSRLILPLVLLTLYMHGCGKIAREDKCHAVALTGKITDCVSYKIPISDFRGLIYIKYPNTDVFTIRYITIWDKEILYDVPYPFPYELEYSIEITYPNVQSRAYYADPKPEWIITRDGNVSNHSVFLANKNYGDKEVLITLPKSKRGYTFVVHRYDDKDLIFYYDTKEAVIASGIFEYIVVH